MGALETLGKLALKMKIMSFKDPEYKQLYGIAPITVNPESYSLDYQVVLNENQAWGTSGSPGKLDHNKPVILSVDLLFDGSGIIDGLPRPTVMPEIELLQRCLLGFIGDKHDIPFVVIVWGSLIFKGRCKSLNLTHKLFSPEGLPTRVAAKAIFSGHTTDILRVITEAVSSPDLTHYRVVKDGDNLPQMCYDIYGDTKYYIQVAKANKLPDFRKMKTGTELFFPPILKTTEQ